jgi:prepilin-type N-terminal cleavage/methylation domain-containing protein
MVHTARFSSRRWNRIQRRMNKQTLLGRERTRRNGFSLVEISVVLAIVTVAVAMLSQTLGSATRLDPVTRETAIASGAIHDVIEQMHNHPFGQIFASYNQRADDDPGGPGTAPGSRFPVDGLMPIPGSSSVGTISFPAIEGRLREDVSDAQLGMPRDLNGDGIVDSRDHSNDCVLFPVRVRVEWASGGKGPPRSIEMYTMIAHF